MPAARERLTALQRSHDDETDRMSRAANAMPNRSCPITLKDALSERYLAYALSTITARSLPDVRDGLKPVQRRILYAMLQLRLDPAGGFKKCARVVGDVIGKFHPHGDVAVYDALVRLAQDFAQRYPLVDGQGNFGNIDGDNAAAMRYTESRLTAVAMALLEGIDEDAVDFRANYDGSDERAGRPAGGVPEPAGQRRLRHRGRHGDQHPAAQCRRAAGAPWPGWPAAPPTAPRPTVEELLRHVQGPDLPTGGCAGRARGQHRRGLPDRPRQLPAAGALGEGGAGLRPVPGGRHRDPLSGAEGPADRADGRAAER